MAIEHRRSGILLHPSSLPGDYGIGEIGPAAFDFIDQLESMGQRYWQLLPLNPIGPCASPYSSSSSGACNDLLVSVEMLVKDGLLDDSDLDELRKMPHDHVDYSWVCHIKPGVLDKAADRFLTRADASELAAYDAFCKAHGPEWLDDFALFSALHRDHDYAPWTAWGDGLSSRLPEALVAAREKYSDKVEHLKVRQFFFDRQWNAVREYAHSKDIHFIGDIPIFVSHDSSDVWANQHMFKLDAQGNPTVIAGVPPDIFSVTGQRWGNPHYNWDAMREDGFRWWKQRMVRMTQLADIVRIDHFLAFNSAWEVPADEPTAMIGEWVKAPGYELFQAFADEFGELPLIAEDLGIITDEVIELRDSFRIPGLHIMQFEINDPDRNPDAYKEQSVTYTGTHDNNTTLGWFRNEGRAALPEDVADQQRQQALEKLGGDGSDVNWRMIDRCMTSPSRLVLFPMQDILDLGVEGRMNVPGTAEGNWEWRYTADQLTEARMNKLFEKTRETGRA